MEPTRRLLAVSPVAWIAAGLSCALFSGAIAWAFGHPYLTGLWLPVSIPVLGSAGTPLLFDLGVYLLVIGMVTHVLSLLWEE